MAEDLREFMIKRGKERADPSKSKKITIGSLMSAKDSKGKDGESKENGKTDEEILKEEELVEAKNASKGKAAQYDQTEMVKKLIIQSIAKYSLIIGSLVVFAIAVIKIGPVIGHALHGAIFDLILGSAKK